MLMRLLILEASHKPGRLEMSSECECHINSSIESKNTTKHHPTHAVTICLTCMTARGRHVQGYDLA